MRGISRGDLFAVYPRLNEAQAADNEIVNRCPVHRFLPSSVSTHQLNWSIKVRIT
jgi:hypothetical protein